MDAPPQGNRSHRHLLRRLSRAHQLRMPRMVSPFRPGFRGVHEAIGAAFEKSVGVDSLRLTVSTVNSCNMNRRVAAAFACVSSSRRVRQAILALLLTGT